MKKKKSIALAKVLWSFLKRKDLPEKCDILLAPGFIDFRLAKYDAQLILDGWARKVIFSGKGTSQNDILSRPWAEDISEARKFAEIAVSLGVPKEKILIEEDSTNTGENIVFSQRMLESEGIIPKKIMIAQAPFNLRFYLTLMKQWVGEKPGIIMACPSINFEEYPFKGFSMDILINVLVGDVQRVIIFSEMGYQIPWDIPRDVLEAYEELIKYGYTKRMMS